jgi:hypothetical protein
MAPRSITTLTLSIIAACTPTDASERVTVDGGTLWQDGAPLPWDGHGYYEVALDAGNLTLAP